MTLSSIAATSSAVINDGGGVRPLVSDIVRSAAANPHLVGATWMVSSAIFTTYSTTRFLKYEASPEQRLLDQHNHVQPYSSTPSSRKSTPSISRPSLLTIYRFGGSFLLGLILHPNLRVFQRLQATLEAAPAFALPALFLFVANFSNSISLDRIGISLTYTTKCAIPILTAIFSVIVDGPSALPNTLALISLLPIAVGIAAASWKSPEMDRIGISAALLSATAQSALTVSSKRVMQATKVTGPSAQRVMVAVGLLITGAMTFTQSRMAIADEDGEYRNEKVAGASSTTSSALPPWLALAALTSYHVEYVLSFVFVGLTSPVTYGTCDAMRRLAVILSGRAFFGGAPLTWTNRAGIGMALLGAAAYSVATTAFGGR